VGTLNFFPDGIESFQFKNFIPTFEIRLGVQNTSNQSFTINSLSANAYSDGFAVGNCSTFNAQTINPNSETILIIDLKMGLNHIVNNIVLAFQYANFSVDLQLKGNVNVDKLQVPLNLKFKVGL